MTDALPGWEQFPFAHQDISHTVYAKGRGPGVILTHELTGLSPPCIALGERLVDAGYHVFMPLLFGPPGSTTPIARNLMRVCISREFAVFRDGRTSPLVGWLRGLCAKVAKECGSAGVGVIGMCLTGNFAIALLAEESVYAPVACQPSLPLTLWKRATALGLSHGDFEMACRRSRALDIPLLGVRFAADSMCPPERFERLQRELGERFEAFTVEGSGHCVLTHDFVDEEQHPTRKALERVLAFLGERLGAKALVVWGALAGFNSSGINQAEAAGFMIRENSAAAVGTMYAGNGSRADAPDTVFNNPAGMTRLTQSAVELGGVVVLPTSHFEGTATVFGAPIPGNDGGNSGKVVVVPHAYWVFPLAGRLKGGIALTVPFGNAGEYDSNWYGRYLGIKTSAVSADINPNLAYRLSDAVSIGAGVSAQYLKLDVSSAIAQFLIVGPTTPDATYRFKGDDWAFGYNAGMLIELGGGTRLGISYRSRIDHELGGELDFEGTSPLLPLVSGPARAPVHLPATTGLSVTHDLSPDLSLSADVQFTHWSVFKDVTIESENPPFVNPQGYRDSWMIAVGGVYRLNQRWALRAGFAWDQTPVTNAYRTVQLPDHDRYMAGVGFGAKLTDALFLDGAYAHSFSRPRASMNQSLNNTDPFTHAVVLSGEYSIAVDLVAFSLRYNY